MTPPAASVASWSFVGAVNVNVLSSEPSAASPCQPWKCSRSAPLNAREVKGHRDHPINLGNELEQDRRGLLAAAREEYPEDDAVDNAALATIGKALYSGYDLGLFKSRLKSQSRLEPSDIRGRHRNSEGG